MQNEKRPKQKHLQCNERPSKQGPLLCPYKETIKAETIKTSLKRDHKNRDDQNFPGKRP